MALFRHPLHGESGNLLPVSSWLDCPPAQVGGLYYGLAALLHVFRKGKNAMERAAMISDTSAFLVLLVVVVRGWA